MSNDDQRNADAEAAEAASAALLSGADLYGDGWELKPADKLVGVVMFADDGPDRVEELHDIDTFAKFAVATMHAGMKAFGPDEFAAAMDAIIDTLPGKGRTR